MPLEVIVILFTLAVLGVGYLSSRVEALEIHRRNMAGNYVELPHSMLVIFRCGLLGIVLLLLVGLKDPVLFLKLALFGALLFGTPHRLVLNLTRRYKYTATNRTITWYHLRKRGYDRLVNGVKEPWNFLLLCAAELGLSTIIIYQTLSA